LAFAAMSALLRGWLRSGEIVMECGDLSPLWI
jgi:hypothetical protein